VPARVLVVGLDAAETSLLERWGAEGVLPAFADLNRRGVSFSLANTIDTLPGGIWPELNSGRSCGKAGFYFAARQLHTGDADVRPVEPGEIDSRTYWSAASAAGRRVAVLDMPLAIPTPGLNGVHVTEWGTHDRPFVVSSEPPGLLDELRIRHGDYPVWSPERAGTSTRAACDAHQSTTEDYEKLLDDLLTGIERKTGLLLEVLRSDSWDLFACAFGEPQCVGHQHWHLQDNPAAPPRLQNAIRDVYGGIDTALAALVEAAGPDATTLVVASHGMSVPTGGLQLVPEVLVRLGMGSGHGVSANVRSRLPIGVRSVLRRVVPGRVRKTLQTAAGSLPRPLESSQTRAVALDGDRVSWIRLNLRGREPHGAIEPGAEAEALIEELRRELLALEDPESGERIVAAAGTAAEVFGPDHHPDIPDLMVSFRTDLGRIEACRSERVGVVRVPYRTPAQRSGAHPSDPSRLWMIGDGRPASTSEGSVLDLAPTVLALLDVPLPSWLDGRPLVAGSSPS
jgi:predicted AlkP superfamily phosphohydrolase/phosphomutase